MAEILATDYSETANGIALAFGLVAAVVIAVIALVVWLLVRRRK